jgi:transcriptional regulator with XRE-family HTH domain
MNYKEYAKIHNIEFDKTDPVFETSNLITEARLYAGLSQAELAKKIGTQQPSIARAEKGAVVPGIEFLEKIAKAIGTYLIPPRFGFMVEREKTTQVYSLAFVKQSRLFFRDGIGTLPSVSLDSSRNVPISNYSNSLTVNAQHG